MPRGNPFSLVAGPLRHVGDEEYHAQYERKFGESKNYGQTYTFACRDAGSAELLQMAIDRGEVSIHEDEAGMKFYKKQIYVTGSRNETVHSKRVGGTQQITKQMAAEAAESLKAMQFAWGGVGNKKKEVTLPEDGKLVEPMQSQVEKAALSADKLVGDATKALELLRLPGMSEGAAKHAAELEDLIATMLEQMNPITKILMLKVVKPPTGQNPDDFLVITTERLIKTMKSVHELVVVAKSMAVKCRKNM